MHFSLILSLSDLISLPGRSTIAPITALLILALSFETRILFHASSCSLRSFRALVYLLLTFRPCAGIQIRSSMDISHPFVQAFLARRPCSAPREPRSLTSDASAAFSKYILHSVTNSGFHTLPARVIHPAYPETAEPLNQSTGSEHPVASLFQTCLTVLATCESI